MKPIVTIIMATYNRAHFIAETLESIQQLTFEGFECLIIDDGGTDNTAEVINKILVKDERFIYSKRPNNYQKGLPGCRNYGLDLAKGNYIVFFDDDDIVHPDHLRVSIDAIVQNGVDFCHYQKLSFEDKSPVFQPIAVKIVKPMSSIDIEALVTQQIGMASCTVLWTKKCFQSIRFREELQYAEEWECYSRIVMEGFKGVIIDSVLYFNRKHPNSNTGEFYNNNPIRKVSKKDAILLVISNLKEKRLLTDFLIRYFVQVSIEYREFKLFRSILDEIEQSNLKKFRWVIFYRLLPFRLCLYKFRKQILSTR